MVAGASRSHLECDARSLHGSELRCVVDMVAASAADNPGREERGVLVEAGVAGTILGGVSGALGLSCGVAGGDSRDNRNRAR